MFYTILTRQQERSTLLNSYKEGDKDTSIKCYIPSKSSTVLTREAKEIIDYQRSNKLLANRVKATTINKR